MENAAKKPTALWRILIVAIPFGVLALCWLFYFAAWNIGGLRDILYICGYVVMAGSAAFVTALIPAIFIRPLSGGAGVRILTLTTRFLLFLFLAAVTFFQCILCMVAFWGYGV